MFRLRWLSRANRPLRSLSGNGERSERSRSNDLKQVAGAVLQNPRSEYRCVRRYQGKIKAVILDWAGTVLDYGVYSPAVAFLEVFRREGVPITMEEARGPMGIHKKVHIRKIAGLEAVRRRWEENYGRNPNESDIERMFENFVVEQLACLKKYTALIPGVLETIDHLQREMNVKIGSTTGFTTPILEILKEEATRAGYVPDCYVAADEVPQARPYPYMVWLNCIRLGVSPIQAVVKVDDTVDGVREGTSAGCWTVAVAKTGNYMGLNESEIAALDDDDYERKLNHSYDILSDAGAHYVIDSIAQLPPVVDDINRRLASGEEP